MQIFINRQQAAIKKGSSFEIYFANRFFDGDDTYSLSIVFPLKDCPQNLAIFGHINRRDANLDNLLFECEIRDGQFAKFGAITVIEIDEVEVKCQFLEGRSKQNFDKTFDNIYINEFTWEWPSKRNIINPSTVNTFIRSSIDDGRTCVALPWVNNTSGNIQNGVVYDGTKWTWEQGLGKALSFQPYLLALLKQICLQLGYSYDFSKIESNQALRYLIICNTLPGVWEIRDFFKALPHWSVTEFFEQLKYVLKGDFLINHKEKKITFSFMRDDLNAVAPVFIEKVVDEFSVGVTEDSSDTNFRTVNSLKYASCDHRKWKYYCLDKKTVENFKTAGKYKSFPTTAEMFDYIIYQKKYNNIFQPYYAQFELPQEIHYLFHAEDVDVYAIMTFFGISGYMSNPPLVNRNYLYKLEPVFFVSNGEEDSNKREVKIVPAWIDSAFDSKNNYKGECLFLESGEVNSDDTDTSDDSDTVDEYSTDVEKVIKKKEGETIQEFFDKIYIAFWDGDTRLVDDLNYFVAPAIQSQQICYKISGLNTSSADLFHGNYARNIDFDFIRSINVLKDENDKKSYKIDETKKYTFKFFAKTPPDPLAVFFIHGQKYLCKQLKATFSEEGMSELLEGEFYKLLEN